MYLSPFFIVRVKTLRNFIKKFYLKYQFMTNSYRSNVIVGAASTKHKNWISTNYPILDLADESTFKFLFGGQKIHAFLAEHVWEHLTAQDCEKACQNCYKYLASGGYLRVAVPDGFHPDKEYINYVRPGGIGLGSDDHKILYNYKVLSEVFTKAGFKVSLLEWFDEDGKFHFVDWLAKDGFVERSTRFDERNKNNPIQYTSLIIDAIKL